jgi:hypothetical protein
MVSPVYRLLSWLSGVLQVNSEPLLLGLVFTAGIGLLVLAVLGASLVTDQLASVPGWRWVGARFVFTLAPIGFGMWSAHYAFHFLTGALAIVPLAQSFVHDLTGRALLGEPAWHLASLLSIDATTDIVLVLLALGFVGSLAWTMQLGKHYRFGFPAILPWIALHTALFLAGVWLLGQPMEMRGTLLG